MIAEEYEVVYFHEWVPENQKPAWLRPAIIPQRSFWMKHQGPIVGGFAGALALAVIAGVVAITSGYIDHKIDGRIDAKLKPFSEKLDTIQREIPELQGELKRIADSTPVRTINDAATASPQRLADNLAQVRVRLDQAREKGEKATDTALAAIQSTLLRVDEKSPGYWPLVFSLISFRSIVITGSKAPPKPRVSVLSNVMVSGPPNT